MERIEARQQLKRLHPELGDWIYQASPAKVRQRIEDYRKDVAELSKDSASDLLIAARVLRLRSKLLLLESGLRCLEVLGCDVGRPPDDELPEGVTPLRAKQTDNIIFHDPMEMEIDEDELDSYALKDVINPKTPRFKVGDEVWLRTSEQDEIDGFIQCIIVGVDYSFEDIHYLIGFVSDDRKTVSTSWECVCETEVVADPEEYEDPHRPSKADRKAHLRLVK